MQKSLPGFLDVMKKKTAQADAAKSELQEELEKVRA